MAVQIAARGVGLGVPSAPWGASARKPGPQPLSVCPYRPTGHELARPLLWQLRGLSTEPQGGVEAVRTTLRAASQPLPGERASPPGRPPNLTQTNNLMLMDKINLRILMRPCTRETDSSSKD